jgi:hypothetical protein
LLVVFGSALIGLIPAIVADAANPEPVTVGMSFLDPVTITENASLRFGLLDVNMANLETIVIAPNDSVTDAGGNVFGGTQGAADLTVTASASQSITILVDNVSTATGYTLGTWMCNYNAAGSNSACDGAGYSETSATSAVLLIGVTLTGNGAAVAGNDDSTFDVTVTYQ